MYARRPAKMFMATNGRKYKIQHGNGRVGDWFKNLGRRFIRTVRNVGRDIAPAAAALAGNAALQYASKKGLSDDLVNLGSQVNQAAAREVQKAVKPQKPLGAIEKASSDVIQSRLAKLLAGQGVRMTGQGVRGLGVRGFGSGVRGFGSGLETVDA